MNRKNFKLTKETKVNSFGVLLHRIECTNDFLDVEAGDLGGWVEKLDNLSGNGWVKDEAEVFGNAVVKGNARATEHSKVYGNATLAGEGWLFGQVEVYGDAMVFGDLELYGNCKVGGDALLKVDELTCGSPGAQCGTDLCYFEKFGGTNTCVTAYREVGNEIRVETDDFSGSIEDFQMLINDDDKLEYTDNYAVYNIIIDVIRANFNLELD